MTFELELWLASKARNPILERLSRRLPVTALGVRSSRTPELARIARAAGNDALWIDLEHSTMSIDVAAQICAAALDVGLVPLVRVPEKDYGVIGRLLDGGALGIIAPRIETARQAAEVAGACRFPPRGQRSAIATLPYLDLRRVPAARLNETMNVATLVKIGVHNIPLVRYLIQQGMQSMADRMEVLHIFYPAAKAADWKLIDAGIRVQAIKKTDGEAGIVHYGTEVITDSDRSISALLGASPGASVSVNIVLEVIKLCLPQLLQSNEGRARMKAMIPIYDVDIKLPQNIACFEEVHRKANQLLQLS